MSYKKWKLLTLGQHLARPGYFDALLLVSFFFVLCLISHVDVLSLNKFGDYVDHIYPIGLEITDTTDIALTYT